ncbi:MAG: acetyl-CoA synthetase, partial [bacterium]|nr:acetyl-CoA synthetase [bacterium]
PCFSECGKYLFFLSDRDFEMDFRHGFASMEFDYVMTRTARMYAMALTPDAANLFKDENDLEESVKAPGVDTKKDKKKKGKGTKGKSDAKKVVVDFNNISSRVSVFPLSKGSYRFLADVGGKILYFKNRELRLFDLKTKKDDKVSAAIGGGSLSANKKKLLYNAAGKWGIMDVKPGQKPGTGTLNLSGLVMKIEPVKEWKQIYNEGWRLFRDWFYVTNMHGVDWKKMKEKYAKLLPYVSHRYDLDYIFGELVGELNVGHTYVNWGDFKKVKRMETGLLGAELKADDKAGRYKITKIYQGENWNERTRSPLTGQGINVKEGDYIISINGYDVTTKDNPYRFLENTVGKKISIAVNAAPSKSGAKTYWIKPISLESANQGLFYHDWVASRRKLVDKLSNGRIGYIHVPNTAVAGNRELFKGVYAYND